MNITVLGSGDAFGSGGRFSTCLYLTADDGTTMLVDCAATSMPALNRAGIDRNAISAILFTHFHGDHFGGLPFFVLDAQFVTRRRAPLTIAGPKGVEERAHIALEAAFPGSSGAKRAFDMQFIEIAPGAPAEVAGAGVSAFAMIHDDRAGPCLGYRIARDNRVFAYSGDTSWTDQLIPLSREADVLLVECYTVDRKLPNHLDYRTLSAHLSELAAKRIILTHMGSSMLEWAEDLPVERAFDGLVIAL
ncbi:MBL fold metallo-hydrolase [Phreatobacter stygius]|uniref:MBL fold metallo-hydrolase n=1 Tax=Phreatobacter stygius TaxID=1940610 RepID=A0A4D7B9Q0_9HYPH|nr:MBL fold metallo-hydrolase [Phreatobacter stygius]QCI64762.1 MBL fold metallo-hydrolase [Phreatobacter stygius]